jgi:hypothetical protein
MKVLLKDAISDNTINSIITVDEKFTERLTTAIEEHYDMEVLSMDTEKVSNRPLSYTVNVTFDDSQTADFVLEQVWEY